MSFLNILTCNNQNINSCSPSSLSDMLPVLLCPRKDTQKACHLSNINLGYLQSTEMENLRPQDSRLFFPRVFPQSKLYAYLLFLSWALNLKATGNPYRNSILIFLG